MKDNKYLRGINETLAEQFKKSSLCTLIKKDKNLLACIRNNAIGIYHLADKVAMAHRNKKRELVCDVNDFYLSGKHTGKEHQYKVEEICERIKDIKSNSLSRGTPEKNAQHTLVSKNNSNPDSEWFCVDIEYRQSDNVQKCRCKKFNGRFDIIAVSKKTPHQIAVIELKYNSSAIAGASGIVKHIMDFKTFSQNPVCLENLCSEIKCQLRNLNQIGVNVPERLLETSFDFSKKIEFYVITLWDDNSKQNPKETMGRYLFNDLRENWVGKTTACVSKKNAMKETGIDVENNPPFYIKFLFKKVQSPTNLNIDDILQETLYDCVL